MIVVADTSVILNLCCIQHGHLLQALYQRVLIPTEVADEFARLAKIQLRFAGLILPDWIEIFPAPKPYPAKVTEAELDAGESAAIALCLEQKAEALLIDELLGRKLAAKLGIRITGIIRILIEARDRNLVSSIKVLLNRLQSEAGFWISPELRAHVLQLTGE
jgi:predicted nucleic acid-binding protein